MSEIHRRRTISSMEWKIVRNSDATVEDADKVVPVIQKKAEWALRYITPELVSMSAWLGSPGLMM
jgi:hypothetical protein